MKNVIKLSLLFLAATVAAGCSTHYDPPQSSSDSSASESVPTSSETPGSSSSSQSSTEESYKIKINVPSTIEATADKSEAKKGETVTIRITRVATGITIDGVRVNGTISATKVNDTTYTFTMPDLSASVTFLLSVSGDVTLKSEDGSITAALAPETIGGKTVYTLRNHKVTSSKAKVRFSYMLGTVAMKSHDLEENLCFANVTFDGKEYELVLASGSTYDFFYDPSLPHPCYIRRTGVDVLPNDAASLQGLFDGSYRSETTVNPLDLKHMTYAVRDTRATSAMEHTMVYDHYANDTVIGKVTDAAAAGEEYAYYKHYDEANEVFTVVDQYAKRLGNDDRTRLDVNKYGAYAARFDVMKSGNEDDYTKTQMGIRDVNKSLNTTPHDLYALEHDIYLSYRPGSISDTSYYGVSYYDIDIASTAKADGFTTSINTVMEYNTGGTTYVEARKEGLVYTVVLDFDARGALTSLNYKEDVYTGTSAWDFTRHIAIASAPTSLLNIQARMEYGAFEAAPTTPFDETPYFLSSIDSIHFYNASLANAGYPDDPTKNQLSYNDYVRITPVSDVDRVEDNVTMTYTPSTAIDLWQYAPVASTNTDVIAKTPNCLYMYMLCVGVGSSTVTLGNHTLNTGIKKDVEIHVQPGTKIRSAYIQDPDYSDTTGEYDYVDTATSATVVAGDPQIKFHLHTSPSNAPEVALDVTSGMPNILEVVSTAKGSMTLSTNTADAKALTEPVTVNLRVTHSLYWEPAGNPTTIAITVTPALALEGTNWLEDYTITSSDSQQGLATLAFTSNAYTGTIPAGMVAPKVATLVDNYGGTPDTYTVAYEAQGAKIVACVVAVSLTSSDLIGLTASDFIIDLAFDANSGKIGVALAFTESSEYEVDYISIFGAIEDGMVIEYTAFKQI